MRKLVLTIAGSKSWVFSHFKFFSIRLFYAMKQYSHIFFILVISDNPGACHRAIKIFLK